MFLIENIRDFNIDSFDKLVANIYAPFFGRKLRREIDETFTPRQIVTIGKIVTYCIDTTLAELLYKLDKDNYESNVYVCISDRTVVANGDRLRMQLYSDEGWIARFSKHYHEDDI